MSKFYQILSLPYLYIRCNFFWWKADKTNLPGEHFFKFGKLVGLKLLQKFILSPKLLLNPVSIVRFFEYDYTLRSYSAHNSRRDKILDISSPYLFGFYLASFFEGEYNYRNPDSNDLTLVKKYSSKIKFKMQYSANSEDATKLTFSNNSFRYIISISVIEHING
ncbi:MAG TPA: hypothetical protein VF870_06080, partial [Ignavibacteriaceae bacterium]